MTTQLDLFLEPAPTRHVIDTVLRVARQQFLASAGFEPTTPSRRPGCGILRCNRIASPDLIQQHRHMPALWVAMCHNRSRWAWGVMMAGSYLERNGHAA